MPFSHLYVDWLCSLCFSVVFDTLDLCRPPQGYCEVLRSPFGIAHASHPNMSAVLPLQRTIWILKRQLILSDETISEHPQTSVTVSNVLLTGKVRSWFLAPLGRPSSRPVWKLKST